MSAQQGVSADTLERVPGRVLTILRAVRRHPVLWNLLATRGYSEVHHLLGWQGLRRVASADGPQVAGGGVEPGAAEAEGLLFLWDETWLPIIDVVLEFDFPSQHAHVFAGGLAPVAGPASVLVVETTLDRLHTLATGEGRAEGDREPDGRAMAALAAHGLTPAVRATAREALTVFQGAVPAVAADPAAQAQAAAEAHEAELQLYQWLKKWSTIAKKVVTRKDHLQWLGLAARKKRVRAIPVSNAS